MVSPPSLQGDLIQLEERYAKSDVGVPFCCFLYFQGIKSNYVREKWISAVSAVGVKGGGYVSVISVHVRQKDMPEDKVCSR